MQPNSPPTPPPDHIPLFQHTRNHVWHRSTVHQAHPGQARSPRSVFFHPPGSHSPLFATLPTWAPSPDPTCPPLLRTSGEAAVGKSSLVMRSPPSEPVRFLIHSLSSRLQRLGVRIPRPLQGVRHGRPKRRTDRLTRITISLLLYFSLPYAEVSVGGQSDQGAVPSWLGVMGGQTAQLLIPSFCLTLIPPSSRVGPSTLCHADKEHPGHC
jgi:hypothetical protein